jgi:hypothetical protein
MSVTMAEDHRMNVRKGSEVAVYPKIQPLTPGRSENGEKETFITIKNGDPKATTMAGQQATPLRQV